MDGQQKLEGISMDEKIQVKHKRRAEALDIVDNFRFQYMGPARKYINYFIILNSLKKNNLHYMQIDEHVKIIIFCVCKFPDG